jgi:hypothetical protein
MTQVDEPREYDEVEALKQLFENLKTQIRTGCPGVITGDYDPDEKTASVRVPFRWLHKHTDGTVNDNGYPVLPDVPVKFPRGGKWIITWPLEKGDIVWVTWSMFPLGEFSQSDGKEDIYPQIPTRFRPGDIWIDPAGGSTDKVNPGKAHAKNWILEHLDGKTKLELQPDGQINMTCSRLNVGADSASNPLAMGNQLQEALNKLYAFGALVQTVSEANGGLLLPGLLAPASLGGPVAPNIKSEKAFTSD